MDTASADGQAAVDAAEATDVAAADIDWFGQPCTDGADCPSGWCIDDVCTDVCTTECPPGWSCRNVESPGPDITYVCAPIASLLCTACETDADCTVGDARCLPFGQDGSFCTMGCDSGGATCPEGFSCESAEDGPASCVPPSGSCSCTKQNAGEVHECTAHNEIGACTGHKTCLGTKGWDACDAPLPAAEACNGHDDDCDGQTDEEGAAGCIPWHPDADADGVGAEAQKCLCGPQDGYVTTTTGDCDDADAALHPGAEELCNALDEDCDGVTDDGTDGTLCEGEGQCPGYTQCAEGVLSCLAKTPAPETCNGLDDDCDGTADEDTGGMDCTTTNDYGTCPGIIVCTGATGASCFAKVPSPETCNGVDDDCDGQTDPEGSAGCTAYLADSDQDGFGVAASTKCLCKPEVPFQSLIPGDCDDAAAAIHPGAAELCNAADDDCSGEVDELTGGKVCTPEGGGQCGGATVCTDGVLACVGKLPAPETCNGEDDDCNAKIDEGTGGAPCVAENEHGACAGFLACAGQDGLVCLAKTPAAESCNGLDDDCDGVVDPAGAAGCTEYAADKDSDGFGADGDTQCLCKPVAPYLSLLPGDCDDAEQAVHPGATERCNAQDDDCDGEEDEGAGGKLCQLPGGGGACPGVTVCTDGVVACEAKTPTPEECNGIDDDCDGTADEGLGGGPCTIDNAAGSCAGTTSCQGALGLICNAKTPTAEACNALDDDCNGTVDPTGSAGCSNFAADADGDGFGLASDVLCLCKPAAPYLAVVTGDCDDTTKAIHPGAAEACNGKDDDCDGGKDEDTGGTVCQVESGTNSCSGVTVCVGGGLSCVGKTPGPEECNGLDDDCNGFVDEGTGGAACSSTNPYGTCAGEMGCTGFAGLVCQAKAAAPETCNGLDDDCDGVPDPLGSDGCVVYAADKDGDGFGVASDSKCLCAPVSPYVAAVIGDCDDTVKAIHPGAAETCNGKDDDCNGTKDDGTGGKVCFVTGGDSKCPGVTVCDGGAITCVGKTPTLEVCNGLDDDCNGTVDEGTAGGACTAANGFGTCSGTLQCLGDSGLACSAKIPAAETCNGLDDDCDKSVDPPSSGGCTTYAADKDGDGFGSGTDTKCLCKPAAPYVATVTGDCDDGDKAVHPGALELCNDVDDDCNGAKDDAVPQTPCKVENGFGACGGVVTCDAGTIVCVGPTPAAEACNGKDDDCDGTADEGTGGAACQTSNGLGTCKGTLSCAGASGLLCSAKTPTAEACNGLDDNCDGATDGEDAAGCTVYYADADGDGWGLGVSFKCLCKPGAPYTALKSGDCDDASIQAYPGAAETCNGVDDNCNSVIDEQDSPGCILYLKDSDGDGYGVTGTAKCLCTPDTLNKATLGGDCNDSNDAVYPNAVEICDDKDQDCDGLFDETCDDDKDGFCDKASTIVGTPAICTAGTGDCNDTVASIHPGAAEVCDNADQNCDGVVDEGVTAPCGGCATLCAINVGPGTGNDWSNTPGDYTNIEKDASNYLGLTATQVGLRTLWVANSGEGTISKIDTPTGKELARYKACLDPSRTAVAPDGSVWVGCRGDGKVAHIALDIDNCKDTSGNGTIETSADANGDGKIVATEMVTNDECVLVTVQPDGNTVARAVGVDKNGSPWVGFWNSKHVRKLDPVTGASLAMYDFSGSGGSPYGIAIAQNGWIWIAFRDSGRLGWINPSPKAGEQSQMAFTIGDGFNAYGLAIDQAGKIWVAQGETGNQGVVRYDPLLGGSPTAWTVVKPPANEGYSRGVAASLDGYVYLVHSSWSGGPGGKIDKIDASTLTVVTSFDVGADRGPVGIALDFDGYLWVINRTTSTATKLNTSTGAKLGEYATGTNPYTYSDMTGFALKTVVAGVGDTIQTFEGWPVGNTQWNEVSATVDLVDPMAVDIRWRVAATKSALTTATWSAWTGPYPPALMPMKIAAGAAVGHYFQVDFRLTSPSKKASPVVKQISVLAEQVP